MLMLHLPSDSEGTEGTSAEGKSSTKFEDVKDKVADAVNKNV